MESGFSWNILLVEDEEFTRGLLANSLEKLGNRVRACGTVSEAIGALSEFEPHVVVTDLDLGVGPSGVDLLERIADEAPWTGLVILTAHASPELAVRDSDRIPEGAVYLVKSQLNSAEELLSVIDSSVQKKVLRESDSPENRIVISRAHGEILRLVALGYSNAGIAKQRNTTVRAVEGMVQRTFLAMGIRGDSDFNARVLAVRMWQQGKVVVR